MNNVEFTGDMEMKLQNAYIQWLASQTLPLKEQNLLQQQQLFLLGVAVCATMLISGFAVWRVHAIAREMKRG